MLRARTIYGIAYAVFGASLCCGLEARADVVLRASHQWPARTGDLRHEVVQMFAREVAAAGVGIEVRVFPGESLLKAREQWSALVRGRLDIAAFPLDYMSGRYPQFGVWLLPGLVKDQAHAGRLNASSFMAEIHRIIESAGVIVLANAWSAGGFVSTRNCILWPDDIKGQVARAAGPAFERMLLGAGASIASMPSSEIYSAMRTGVLDAAVTSSASFMSFRIYELVKCFTAPGERSLWFAYAPILMAKKSWDALTADQQAVVRAAGRKAEAFFAEEVVKQDALAEQVFRDAGVEVVHLSPEQADSWRTIAEDTSYKIFADEVPGGRALIESALAVE